MSVILFIAVLIWIFSVSYKEKDKGIRITDGPKLNDRQKKLNYKLMREFFEEHPDYDICKQFPEYMRDISLSNRYQALDTAFKSGLLSYADYQIELNELAKEIDITPEAPKNFWQRIKDYFRKK